MSALKEKRKTILIIVLHPMAFDTLFDFENGKFNSGAFIPLLSDQFEVVCGTRLFTKYYYPE